MKEICKGVFSIRHPKAGHVHAFLIDGGDGLIVIDMLYDADARRLIEAIRERGWSPSDIKHLVLTHAHFSHIAGLARLKRLSDAAVYSHAWEADIVSGKREAQRVSLIPRRPFRMYHIQAGCALGRGIHVPCAVDIAVSEGDRIGPLHVLHTPGHTPGSLCFHWPERKLLIVGDLIVSYPRIEAGWKGLTLNFQDSRASLARIAHLPDVEILGVGHGEPITEDVPNQLCSLLGRYDGKRPASLLRKFILQRRRREAQGR